MRTIPAKTILSGYAESGWFGANYNMNLYKGCCHGCIYCDSRSDCYRVEEFDTVRAKENALNTLERDLRGKRKKGIVGTGAMSDCYNPFEKQTQLMRGALELFERYRFGVAIDTKSDLVLRDADLLCRIKAHSPVAVTFTVTTADDGLCRKIERRVCPTSARLAAMKELSSRGIVCGALLMPLLPFINDTEENVLSIVRMAKESGAKHIYPGFGVTLRSNQREYFFARLNEEFPGLKEKYIRQFGGAYLCDSPRAKELWNVFTRECENANILYQMPDIVRNIRAGYEQVQTRFF